LEEECRLGGGDMKKNRGLTMVEMLIVLAIMALLSGMSFVTIGIIKQAKFTSAADTLNNQFAALKIKTNALGGSETAPGKLCMKIRYNKDDTQNADGTTNKRGTFSLILGYADSSGNYLADKDTDTIECNLALPWTGKDDDTVLQYTAVGSSTPVNCKASEVVIVINKSSGSVEYGAGKYEFFNGNDLVATVYLDKDTGNHYVK
jgi:prepilin-type N-terminal cleavage/methylation domain-containing protein